MVSFKFKFVVILILILITAFKLLYTLRSDSVHRWIKVDVIVVHSIWPLLENTLSLKILFIISKVSGWKRFLRMELLVHCDIPICVVIIVWRIHVVVINGQGCSIGPVVNRIPKRFYWLNWSIISLGSTLIKWGVQIRIKSMQILWLLSAGKSSVSMIIFIHLHMI